MCQTKKQNQNYKNTLPLMGWALKQGIAGNHIRVNAKILLWIEHPSSW